MSTIEQARDVAECLRALLRNRNDGSAYLIAADTIDALIAELAALKAALQERDAEIERLKYTVKRRDVGIEICATLSVKMEAKLAAQRNVLEQALEALLHAPWKNWRTDKAITAIQGQLK